jgi:hypothetical protein
MLLTHYWGRQGLCRKQIAFYAIVFFYQSAEYFSMQYRGPYSHTLSLWGRTQQRIGTLSSLPHGLFIQLDCCLEERGGGDKLTLLLDGSHSNWGVNSCRVRCGTLLYTLFSCHFLGIATRYKFLCKKEKKNTCFAGHFPCIVLLKTNLVTEQTLNTISSLFRQSHLRWINTF